MILLVIFASSESFWKNPQFQLTLKEQDQSDDEDDDEDVDDEDDSDEAMSSEERKRTEKQKQKSKQCTVLVELLQKNRRQKDKIHFLYIAFHIYKVTSPLLYCSLLIDLFHMLGLRTLVLFMKKVTPVFVLPLPYRFLQR